MTRCGNPHERQVMSFFNYVIHCQRILFRYEAAEFFAVRYVQTVHGPAPVKHVPVHFRTVIRCIGMRYNDFIEPRSFCRMCEGGDDPAGKGGAFAVKETDSVNACFGFFIQPLCPGFRFANNSERSVS